ncbi:hypothetical protein ACFQY5_35325 [Paeniroseomonas aquatica]|uniref:hypothetical protein n=1 Tax=Paeniroseomonas aquatica TaxID=373043 RepID=UPI00361CBF19
MRQRLEALHTTLDPIRLLQSIRTAQQRLVEIANRPVASDAAPRAVPTLEQFLSGLRTAWQEGEVRPTAQPKQKVKRLRPGTDPFAAVTVQLHDWFAAEPWQTSRELLDRLQAEQPGDYPDGQLRT